MMTTIILAGDEPKDLPIIAHFNKNSKDHKAFMKVKDKISYLGSILGGERSNDMLGYDQWEKYRGAVFNVTSGAFHDGYKKVADAMESSIRKSRKKYGKLVIAQKRDADPDTLAALEEAMNEMRTMALQFYRLEDPVYRERATQATYVWMATWRRYAPLLASLHFPQLISTPQDAFRNIKRCCNDDSSHGV
jgi:hypothetical protein